MNHVKESNTKMRATGGTLPTNVDFAIWFSFSLILSVFLSRSLKNTYFQRGSCTFEDGNIVWGSGKKSSFISCRTLRGTTEAQIRHKTSQNFINIFIYFYFYIIFFNLF